MHARTKLGLAVALLLVAGTLQAAPWERADSKIQGYNIQTNNPAPVRRSTRAYSYSPQAATTTAPTTAIQLPAAQAPVAVQVPATRPVQSVAPRTQSGAVVTVPPSAVAPTNPPATNYAPAPTRGYRSYSYQPAQPSPGYRNNYRARTRRTPFYMRADSKIMGREGM
ncbi:MAG TPA: hypothetical protein VIK18_07875 [Pirellulales bacterium]